MSNNRYLEISSAFRDRQRFPKPGQFEIPISISGRKNSTDAVDPVSLSVPIMSWTSNNLSTNNPTQFKLLCTVEPKTTMLSGITDTTTFVINSAKRLQQLDDYYRGLIVEDAAFFNRRRIKKYTFIGSFPSYDRAIITVENAFPETFVPTNQIYIYDPTDLSSAQYPFFWVPNSRLNENAYVNYILYNETLNEYRNITGFSDITKCLTIDVSSEPITSWHTNDNYSIRKEKPFYPDIGGLLPRAGHQPIYDL